MNANELAQEFEEYLKEIEELPWGNHQILCDQAADLLRQQQAEIEALKEALQAVITISDRKHDAWDKAKELLK